ncbi:hypothetical protein J5N97_010377 [Dioscorea zingiberensis]|uniref:Btz domain-containing protein n=1 Tax=Dioscorea zingiberensis TaxID=325984 RepID=A0A9D5D0I8_9LILI|nr:hypothetical protein J5N97_010377 [Dioscorea zingiberensis]
MSRREREREGRDSHSRRFHSRSERDHRSDRESRPDRGPSPKKARRDGKPAMERIHGSESNLETLGSTDPDLKQHRRLKDPLPLEDPAPEKKVEPEFVKKISDKKVEELSDGNKHSSNPSEIPRSRGFFQHDERGSAGHGGRSFIRKATDHGRWSEPKEQLSERARDRTDAKDTEGNDDKAQSRADEKSVWRHDGFYELETDAPPARKRPAFREKKIPVETDPAATETEAEPRSEQLVSDTARKEERGHYSRGLDRPGRPYPRGDERYAKRGDGSYHRESRPGYQSRDRYAGGVGGSGIRGRDRFNGRYPDRSTQRPGPVQPEKWKHDLFDEANKSPIRRNEEEQIAKVEALLSL